MKGQSFKVVFGALIALSFGLTEAKAETVRCEGRSAAQEQVTVVIRPTLSPGMPPELRYLAADAKLNSRWLSSRVDVVLVRTSEGLSYRDRLSPKNFKLILDADALPGQAIPARLVLFKDLPYEARYESLSCTVEGELLYRLTPCPESNALIQQALYRAAKQGSARDLENILGCRADASTTDQNQCTALHFVTDLNCGRPDFTGNPDLPPTDPRAGAPIDHRGRGTLVEEELIRLLGDAEAAPNAVDRFGKTPLRNAVQNQQSESAIALLDLGANVNYQNALGNTVLMDAASQGDEMMIRILIGGNPDLRLTNRQGKTALDLARENHHEHLADLLTPHAARFVIQGKADGSCAPTMIHLTHGEEAEIVLEAKTNKMFLLEAPDLQLELMAMPNGTDSKTIRPARTGTFPFTCGVHGAPDSAQTRGSFMVM